MPGMDILASGVVSAPVLSPASDLPARPKVAVIGLGYWGPNWVRVMQGLADCDLVAVCDQQPAALARIAQQLPPTVATHLQVQAILDDPTCTAVVIATDIPTHADLVRQALLAGKHVLVEKPLALTAAECQSLGQLADAQDRVLLVGHTFLYNAAVRYLKNLIDQGDLGQVFYLHSQRLNLGRVQTKTNPLWSLAVHDVAIVLYLLGQNPVAVQCTGQDFLTPGVPDVVFMHLTFPSGVRAQIHASWLDPEKKRQVTVVGSQKMVVYDDVSVDRKIAVYDKGIDKGLDNGAQTLVGRDSVTGLADHPGPDFSDFGEFQLRVRSGDMWIPQIHLSEPLKVEAQHFIDCMVGRQATPLTDWRNGCVVVGVLEAAQASLDQGGVTVPMAWDGPP